MKRVILTGATGFIGRQAITELLARNYEIVALTSQADATFPAGVETRMVDLSSPQAVDEAVKKDKASHLLHLAWQPVKSGLWMAPENLDWVEITLNLARSFIRHGGERMTFSGSCGEYDWTGGLCVEELTPLRPTTHYGACKHALDTMISSLARISGVSYSWGRAFFIYGAGEHSSRLGASVALSVLKGEPAKCSHGLQLRDYTHVADVASGYVALLDSEAQGAFNIASGTAIRVRDLVVEIADAAGRRDLVQLGALPAPDFEPPLIVADMTKTHAALDWRPTFSLEKGAADIIQHYAQQI